MRKRSSRTRASPGWWFVILLMLAANLIVTGTLLWIVLSDLLTIQEATGVAENRATPRPAVSTMPPNATPEPAPSRQLSLAPTRTATPGIDHPPREGAQPEQTPFPPVADATRPLVEQASGTPGSPAATPSPTASPEETETGDNGRPAITGSIPTPDGVRATFDAEGIRLVWRGEPGRRYRIYSNLGRGLEMYRLVGETGGDQWLDREVRPSRVYHYRIVAVTEVGRSAPAAASVSTPLWRWRLAGWSELEGRTDRPIAAGSPIPEADPLPVTLVSHAGYLDGERRFHVVALLRNDHPRDLVDVMAIVELMDADGQILRTVTTEPYGESIPAGETVPLHAVTEGIEPVKYSITTLGVPGRAHQLSLVVELSQGTVGNDGYYYVEGRIRNTGTAPVQYPRVAVAILDDSDRPVNASIVMPVPAQIDAGGTATFRARFNYFPRVDDHQIFMIP